MENKAELVRLEQFVDSLLAKYKQLKQSCSTLEANLAERDLECAKLKETVEELRSERSVVGERVAGLLGKIEQWEVDQEADDVSEISDEDELGGVQGTLFTDKTETVEQ